MINNMAQVTSAMCHAVLFHMVTSAPPFRACGRFPPPRNPHPSCYYIFYATFEDITHITDFC
jgi:hypothetical protein